ncbi:MAG: hypothetical protein FWC41_01560 [Firmicutes bacterium]|nr:hypothetical protein [Bacillota bacterium]
MIYITINKDLNLFNWLKTNPLLTDTLKFDFLGADNNSCSISPIPEDTTIKTYIDGTKVKQYSFALQSSFSVSENTDMINIENMKVLRSWQDWLSEQNGIKNFPDFGENCEIYKLEVLSNPQMSQFFENGIATYQFFLRLEYIEYKNNRKGEK